MKRAPKKDKPTVDKKKVDTTPADEAEIEAERGHVKNFASVNRIRKKAEKLYELVEKAFRNKQDQNDNGQENWDIYECTLTDKQQYSGNHRIFVPIVRDAINARKRHRMASLFPVHQKRISCVSMDGEEPYELEAMLEHHVRTMGLRKHASACLLNGDIEGQWSMYVDWYKREMPVRVYQRKHPEVRDDDDEVIGEDPDQFEDSLTEEMAIEERPEVMALPASDLAVIPPTVDDIEDADAVAVMLRLSKEAVRKMQDDKLLEAEDVADLLTEWKKTPNDRQKKAAEAAGVRVEGTRKFAQIYEVHAWMRLDHRYKERAVIWFTGPNRVGGIIRNPTWRQRLPVISHPVEKRAGSFWGIPRVDAVKDLQYHLNDTMMQGADSADYALLPIVMTDPEKNPNTASMIIGLAALWETNPNDTKFVNFPPLWKDAMMLVAQDKAQILESLDVNEAMLGRAPAGRKNNQAVAQQMQQQMLALNDETRDFEEFIMNRLLDLIFELDQQFRTKDLTVFMMGEMGRRAQMIKVTPRQFAQRYHFRWVGTESFFGMQRAQTAIQLLNVLRGLPPNSIPGKRINFGPLIETIVSNTVGHIEASKVIEDIRFQLSVDPNLENEMLANGLPVTVSPLDDDAAHLQAHNFAARLTTDPSGFFRKHIMDHMAALQQKAAAAAPNLPGRPGIPGPAGAPGMPGVPGTPRPGAVPMPPRGTQAPPGQVPADGMADAGVPGRG